MAEQTVREVVGVFESPEFLQKAADELMVQGIDRAQLSVLARRHLIEERLGGLYDRVESIEDDPRVPLQAYVGTDSLTIAQGALVSVPAWLGGTVAAAVSVAAGAGTLAILGSTLAVAGLCALVGLAAVRAVQARRRQAFDEQLERGGFALWVRTPDAAQEEKALAIMRQVGARDTHAHDCPRLDRRGYLYGCLDWLAGARRPVAGG